MYGEGQNQFFLSAIYINEIFSFILSYPDPCELWIVIAYASTIFFKSSMRSGYSKCLPTFLRYI